MATKEQVEFVWKFLQESNPETMLKSLNEGNAGIGAVLGILYEASGDMTAGNISELMHVSTARVAVLLKNMEAKGLIVKDCDANDARVTIVRLSETGKEKIQQMRHEAYARIEMVIDQVGIEKMQEFITIFGEIKSAIQPPDIQF